jgi:hypothetical protein
MLNTDSILLISSCISVSRCCKNILGGIRVMRSKTQWGGKHKAISGVQRAYTVVNFRKDFSNQTLTLPATQLHPLSQV